MRFLKLMIVYCTILSTILSCSNYKPKGLVEAKNVISKDSMILIFTDMHLADAEAQITNGKNLDSLTNAQKKHYEQIFNHYKINNQRFKTSLQYYTQHPELLDEMYKEVVNKLSKLNN